MSEQERVWQDRLQKWRASGMKRRDFCDQHQLKVSTLDYWQPRLRGDDDKPGVRTTPASARLIPLEVLSSTQMRYEVRLANGRQLVVSGKPRRSPTGTPVTRLFRCPAPRYFASMV